MTDMELKEIFEELCKMASETEIVEFKEAKNSFDFQNIGRYFSALSNEANLKGVSHAWLVFGVKDKNHQVVGTTYRLQNKDWRV